MKRYIRSNTSDYMSDDEMYSVLHNGSDEEIEIAAICYNYGVTYQHAKELHDTLSQAEIEESLQAFYDKDLPQSDRIARYKTRQAGKVVR